MHFLIGYISQLFSEELYLLVLSICIVYTKALQNFYTSIQLCSYHLNFVKWMHLGSETFYIS